MQCSARTADTHAPFVETHDTAAACSALPRSICHATQAHGPIYPSAKSTSGRSSPFRFACQVFGTRSGTLLAPLLESGSCDIHPTRRSLPLLASITDDSHALGRHTPITHTHDLSALGQRVPFSDSATPRLTSSVLHSRNSPIPCTATRHGRVRRIQSRRLLRHYPGRYVTCTTLCISASARPDYSIRHCTPLNPSSSCFAIAIAMQHANKIKPT